MYVLLEVDEELELLEVLVMVELLELLELLEEPDEELLLESKHFRKCLCRGKI